MGDKPIGVAARPRLRKPGLGPGPPYACRPWRPTSRPVCSAARRGRSTYPAAPPASGVGSTAMSSPRRLPAPMTQQMSPRRRRQIPVAPAAESTVPEAPAEPPPPEQDDDRGRSEANRRRWTPMPPKCRHRRLRPPSWRRLPGRRPSQRLPRSLRPPGTGTRTRTTRLTPGEPATAYPDATEASAAAPGWLPLPRVDRPRGSRRASARRTRGRGRPGNSRRTDDAGPRYRRSAGTAGCRCCCGRGGGDPTFVTPRRRRPAGRPTRRPAPQRPAGERAAGLPDATRSSDRRCLAPPRRRRR